MSYQWDPKKAASNLQKHGIDFADAVAVFEDLNAITIEDPDEHEERYVTLGMDAYGQIIVVVYSYVDVEIEEHIRIISARKATKRERQQYEG